MREEHYWRQKDGSLVNIRDMDESHIKNCFKFLPQHSEWIEIFNNELHRREKEITTEVNGVHSLVNISIGLSRMPEHCGECPFYINTYYYDEDAFFGDGIQHYCPFKCSYWGCLVKRPDDCPLTKMRG